MQKCSHSHPSQNCLEGYTIFLSCKGVLLCVWGLFDYSCYSQLEVKTTEFQCISARSVDGNGIGEE